MVFSSLILVPALDRKIQYHHDDIEQSDTPIIGLDQGNFSNKKYGKGICADCNIPEY